MIALAVLFALAAAPALLLRGDAAASPARSGPVAEPVVAPAPPEPAPPSPPPASTPCLQAGIPVFAGATPAGPSELDQSVVHAINALTVGPHLDAAGTLRAPFQDWTSGMQRGKDLLSFYAKRMRPVNFWDMTARLRNLIGVRPRGTVDSPPLLYVNPSGAVLLRPHPNGTLDLVLLCPAGTG